MTTKRNTGRQQDSPHDAFAASLGQIAGFELGVRVTVSELFGWEALETFEAHVAELWGPLQQRRNS